MIAHRTWLVLGLLSTIGSGDALSQAAPTPKPTASTAAKPETLDVRGANAEKFVTDIKITLTKAKEFLKAASEIVSDDATIAAKATLLDAIEQILNKGNAISEADQIEIKKKRDALSTKIDAMTAIKKSLEEKGLSDLTTRVDTALGEIKKIDMKSQKISIVSAEYGDLTYRIGRLSKKDRYCDIKLKAIKACQNKPYCTLSTTGICNDPAPQADIKKIRVIFQCIGVDTKPVLVGDPANANRTAESSVNATELLVGCEIPEGGYPNE